MRTLQRRMPVAWTHRCAVVCRACVRELLYMAVIVSLTLVNLNQRILADICIVAEQRHEQQLAGAYRTLCSSKASAQHLSTSWSSSMKVIATYPWQGLASLWAAVQLVWLHIKVIGDLEVAAYITSHATMLALLVLPAWRLRPAHPLRRHLVCTFTRLLHAMAVPLAVVTSAMPQYHIMEMMLQVARWRVFAGAGWMHALLLQVPLHWQVPLGVAEYAILAWGCTWMDAAAGRPRNTLLQHLWEFAMAVLLPTALIWWWSRGAQQHPGASAGCAGGVLAASGAAEPAAAGKQELGVKASISSGEGGCGSSSKDTGLGDQDHPFPDEDHLNADQEEPAKAACASTAQLPGALSGNSSSCGSMELEPAVVSPESAGQCVPAAESCSGGQGVTASPVSRQVAAVPAGVLAPAANTATGSGPLLAAAAAAGAYRPYVGLDYVPVTRTTTLALKVDSIYFSRDADRVLATVTHTLEPCSSYDTNGINGINGGNGSWRPGAVLQTCVAVPGCVLVLAQVTSLAHTGQPALLQMQGGCDAASSCVVHAGGAYGPALDGNTWRLLLKLPSAPPRAATAAGGVGAVGSILAAELGSSRILSPISSSSGGSNMMASMGPPGAASLYFPSLEHMQQALRSGVLTTALQTMQVAPQVATAGPAAAVDGTLLPSTGIAGLPGSCAAPASYAVIGTWGQPVKLQLQWPPGGLPGLSTTGHAAAAAAGDQGGAAGAVAGGAQLRVVVSRHRSVVLDTALAVPVEGGEGGALLTLQPPALAAAAAGVGPGGSAPAAAAAFSVDLVWNQEHSYTSKPQQKQAQGVPPTVTHASLLLLEEPVAGELVTWVTTHRVPAPALSELVQDMSFLLATRQQMQVALEGQTAAHAISIAIGQEAAPPEPAAAAKAATAAAAAAAGSANALKAFRIALPLADHLEAYLRSCGLHLTCDMVLGVKQQLLLASVQLQPLAAGVTGSPSREVGSTPGTAAGAAAGPAQGNVSSGSSSGGGSTGAPGEAGAGASSWSAHLTATPSHPAAQTAVVRAGGVAAMAAGVAPRAAAVAAASNTALRPVSDEAALSDTSSSEPDMATDIGSGSVTSDTPVKPKSTAGTQGPGWVSSSSSNCFTGGVAAASSTKQGESLRQHAITEGDRDAVAAGGWRGALLCWRGFACSATEAAYLQYKADHLWLWDFLCQLCVLAVNLQMASRFMDLTGQGLWPLHRVYGSYFILERVAHLAFMLARNRWRCHRSTWLLLFGVRNLVWLTYEAYMWPQELLLKMQGNTNKGLLFLPITVMLTSNVPKAMVWTWFCFNPAFVYLSLACADPQGSGVNALAYWLRQRGGVPLLLYCLGLTVVNLGVVMVEAVMSDLKGRQAFIKQQGEAAAGKAARRKALNA